jgi:uncharacterized protein YndB with AHSA1/START domain
MTQPTDRPGSGVVSFPDELEILITRDFAAPIQLVYDVFMKEEHVRNTIAPYGETVTECTFDVRVGGEYRYTFVTDDGDSCSFHGIFLDVDEPHRTVETWIFDGWPDVEAVETIALEEHDGVTTMRWHLRFADAAGRAHMKKFDGVLSNFDNVAAYLETLLGG